MGNYSSLKEARYDITVEGAKTMIQEWINSGRGVQVWKSANLSTPGAATFTPGDASKPRYDVVPVDLVTSINKFRFVKELKEVKRFHVGIRRGAQGFSLKVTDGGSRRINRELLKLGPEAAYHFDYETQEVVLSLPVWEE